MACVKVIKGVRFKVYMKWFLRKLENDRKSGFCVSHLFMVVYGFQAWIKLKSEGKVSRELETFNKNN